MNKILLSAFILTITPTMLMADDSYTEKNDIISYTMGYQIGSNLKSQPVELNQNALQQGMNDAISGKESSINPEKAKQVMSEFQKEAMEKRIAEHNAAAEKNKQSSETFLTENKQKDGVITLPSGLQYMVIEEGEGPTPGPKDTVTTHYKGTLVDGTVFDSSYKRGEPATFPVNGVIKGWTEALQLMKTGAKWKIFIPSDLAYGERGAGRFIPPNSALIFDIELLDIKDATATN